MKSKNNTKFYFFIGTTAELIKLFPIMKSFKEAGLEYKIISSGQNNIVGSDLLKLANHENVDFTLSNDFIKQTPLGLISWFVKTLFKNKPDLKNEFKNKTFDKYLLLHGDTVSTVMGALIAKFYGLKIVHIEAGLRSFNYLHPFPEELDRVIVSKLSNINFCPNDWSVKNIKNKRSVNINTFQNTLIDSLEIATKTNIKSDLLTTLSKNKYFVFVIHRQENILNEEILENTINKVFPIANNKLKCLFVLHEPTKVALEKFGILKSIDKNKDIIITPRLNYIEFMKVLDGCEFIITDGGSNQEESYYLGKPCLILREKTERIEGLNTNVIISKNNPELIDEFINNPYEFKHDKIISDTKPSEIITKYFLNKVER